VAKFAKKTAKNRPKMTNYSSHITSETKHSRTAKIGVNIAHGVRMMPKLFVFWNIFSILPKFVVQKYTTK